MTPTFNLALRRQRQGNLCEFEASLVYIVISSQPVTATNRKCGQWEELGDRNQGPDFNLFF